MITDQARWQRLSQLFDRAIDLDVDARSDLLDAECVDDPALRVELQRMLDADAAASEIDGGVPGMVDLSVQFDHDEQDRSDGNQVGPWQLQSMLGQGGMGSVYAAVREDDNSHRAAVKRLHRRWDGSEQAQRFLQERRILASLSHRNLPRLIDHGLDRESRPWFALEYIDGQTLIEWADNHRLDLRARLQLFRQVCAAVQHAHERFVVHRDLKPANILVDAQGHPKVLDFGVAKRLNESPSSTRTGAFAGFTPDYAAPEQISGGIISAATDVYALGVILYQLLTGQLPYRIEHDNLRDVAEAVTTRIAERMDRALATGEPTDVADRVVQRNTSVPAFRRFVRGDLTRIVQTALAKEPERRYASVQAFSGDLARFLEGRTVSVGGDTVGYRARKFIQRNRWGVAMAVLAGLALVAGFIGVAWQVREARAQRDAAFAEVSRTSAVRDYVMLMFRSAADRPDAEHLSVRDVLTQGADEIFRTYRAKPETGVLLANSVAELYIALGDLEGADALLERVLKLQGLEQFPHQRAFAQKNLGTVEYFRGNPARARKLLDAAQAFWNLNPSRYRLDLLDSRTLQAQLERAEGHPEASVATLKALLAERKTLAAGKPDRDAAQSAGNLSMSLMALGRPGEAKTAAQESWDTYQKLGLQNTSDALGALNNLAVAALRQGDFVEAERAARLVYDARRKLFPVSQDTAAAEQNVATAIAKQGRAREAIPLYEDALQMAVKEAGLTGIVGLTIRPNLADAYTAAGRYRDARDLADTQLAIARAQFGESSPFFAAGLRARAGVRLESGDYASARADLAVAESIYLKQGNAGKFALADIRALQGKLPH